jgi:hypothetical protein
MVMWFHEPKSGSGHWYTCPRTSMDPSDLANSVSNNLGDAYTYVDDTYIKVRYSNNTASNLTIKYYYFIFADNG